jgi:hypothetical protein
MFRRIFWSLVIALVVSNDASAGIIVYDVDVDPTKANGDYLPGTSIPRNHFAANIDPLASTFLKARGRDTGQPLSLVNSLYLLQPGLAMNGVSPWWNFDFQFSAAASTLPTDYVVSLSVDFDPSQGVDYTTITLPALAWGGFMVNPMNGSWSNNTTPFVVADSFNMGFAFWQTLGAPPFNPNIDGTYEINLTAIYLGNVVSSIDITAQVGVGGAAVPEPGALALASLGILGFAGAAWRRRQMKKAASLTMAA